MLTKGICGRIQGLYVMSTFYEMYYGQTPHSTTFVQPPSDRTTPTLQDRRRCQPPAPLPDGLTRPSGALGGRHCDDCLPQPRYRGACPQTLSSRRARWHPAPQSARDGSHRDPRVDSRTAAGPRPRSAYGWRPQCQLDHGVTGHVSGDHNPYHGHRRNRALVSAGGGLCVQALHVDPQTPSRRAAGLRGKRLRVEVILAGAGTPTPPPVPALVELDLLDEVPPDLEELWHLLPRADLSLQDAVQFAFHPTLTRVWCRKGRRGQRLVEAPGANDKVYGCGLVDWCAGWFDGRLAPGRTADIFCGQVRAR